MLRFLSIRNLAVIDRLELEFEPGLNVLTGETGTGKSILVGAVGLLVGGRASAELVRTEGVVAVLEREVLTVTPLPATRGLDVMAVLGRKVQVPGTTRYWRVLQAMLAQMPRPAR